MTNGKTKWFTLAAACLALFMAILDNLVVNVALPTISRDLRAGTTQLQWIVSAYTLVFASLQITAGGLGDRLGRKRWFLIGLALFTGASLFGATSQSVEMLIAARALQGVGAAFIMPLTLALISAAFTPEERPRAIGIWASISISGLALGPIVGGVLVQYAAWQWVFLVNVPIGIVTFLIALRYVKEGRNDSGRVALDVPGTLLITGAIASLTWGLIEAGERGWTDPFILAALALAAVLLGAFIAVESRVARPMVPLAFFRNPTFTGANLVSFALSFAIASVAFFLTLYQQNIHGYTPVQAGLTLLPMVIVTMIGSPFAGAVVGRFGARLPIALGVAINAAGMLLFLRTGVDATYLDIVPAFLVLGVGGALINAPITTAILNSVDVRRSGVASAIVGAVREVGAVFSIALLGTIANRVYRADYNAAGEVIAARSNPDLPEAARAAIEFVGGGASFAGRVIADARRFPDLPEPVIALVQGASGRAFISGMHTAILVSGVALLLMSAVSFLLIRDAAVSAADAVPDAAALSPSPEAMLAPGTAAALPALATADEFAPAGAYVSAFDAPLSAWAERHANDGAEADDNVTPMHPVWEEEAAPVEEHALVASGAGHTSEAEIVRYAPAPADDAHMAPAAWHDQYAGEGFAPVVLHGDGQAHGQPEWRGNGEPFVRQDATAATVEPPSEPYSPAYTEYAPYDPNAHYGGNGNDEHTAYHDPNPHGNIDSEQAAYPDPNPHGNGHENGGHATYYDPNAHGNGNGGSYAPTGDYAPAGVGYDPAVYYPPQVAYPPQSAQSPQEAQEAYAAQWQLPLQGVGEGYAHAPQEYHAPNALPAPYGQQAEPQSQGWYGYAPNAPTDTAALAWRANVLETRISHLEGRDPVAGLDGRLAALEGRVYTTEGQVQSVVGRDEHAAALAALTRQVAALEASLTRFTREVPVRLDGELAALERRVAQLMAELPATIRAEWQAVVATQAQDAAAMRERIAALEGLEARVASQEKLDAKVSQLTGLDTRIAGLERMEPKVAEVERFAHALPPVPWYREQATRAEALESRVAELERFANDLARRGTLARDVSPTSRTEPKGRPVKR